MEKSKGIGREFMELTQYRYMCEPSDQEQEKPQPPLEMEMAPESVVVTLPLPEEIRQNGIQLEMGLVSAIEQRTSCRTYGQDQISVDQLSYLLWLTQGVRRVIGDTATLRNVPSAGCRHSLETYLLVNGVEGLKPGLYRFMAIGHKLIEVNMEPEIAQKITQACLNQKFILQSCAAFFWVAEIYRMEWRYKERSYRYIHLDAGHVCQNLYLAAETIDCGVCAIGAFRDEELNPLLEVDGINQFAVYGATLGKREKNGEMKTK